MAGGIQDKTNSYEDSLRGTTLKVYRRMFRTGKPMKINEIQRSLGLSSPSVAQYHVKKLLQFGLIREVPEGYLVENVVFENLIRFRRVSIPIQTGYAGFFLGALAVLLTVFRPLN